MRTLALVLVLFSGCAACESPTPPPADPYEIVGGYEMGNLPVSRTVTFISGDAVPPNLLNEIQDDLIALNILLTGGAQVLWPSDVVFGGGLAVIGGATITGKLVTLGANAEGGIINATLNSALANDDFSPTGIGSASVIRLSLSAGAAVFSGMNAGINSNRSVLLVNVAAANITLKHEVATSSEQFRFALPNSADVVIRPNGSIRAWYDTASTRYRVLGI